MDIIQKKLIELSYKISPDYCPVSQHHVVDNKHILVIWSPAGDLRPYKTPVSLSAKRREKAWYIRRGSKTIKVKEGSEDERKLLELTARIPFDDRINHQSSLEDLDLRLIQAHLRQIMSSLYEESSKIPFRDLCKQMKIVKGPGENLKPTNAGLLLFNGNPDDFFEGARIDVVIHKGKVGKNYTEKIFRGPVQNQVRDVLDFFKSNIIEEVITKSDKKPEAVRFFNYPYQAIEEALVNAVYHKSYKRPNPVEIQILDDKIEILNFPGPMPPVDKKMLQQKQRIITREYRNRKLGDYFKELKLTEGRGTGLPIIYRSMEKNGSTEPSFETDEERSYFLCTLLVHPLANNVLVSRKEPRRDISEEQKINSLSDINSYLRSGGELSWDQVGTKLGVELQSLHLNVISFCQLPKSRAEILEHIGLFNNTRNFNNYIKPIVDIKWLTPTHPDKPTSKIQQYYTTELGKKLLKVFASVNKSGMVRSPLASSNIASVGYDKERMILEVEFHNGTIYQYFDVPEKVYTGLINAPSHGAYFQYEVKDKFSSEKKN
ncbi:MAG: KTSC domain-containing protein [Flavobacteriales bacterium]|nr:KTSC domain-containing protein [Flavobacteriales bacterium]